MPNFARDFYYGAQVAEGANKIRESRIKARDERAYAKAVNQRIGQLFGIEMPTDPIKTTDQEPSTIDQIKDFLGFGPGTPIKPSAGGTAPAEINRERPIDLLLDFFSSSKPGAAAVAPAGAVATEPQALNASQFIRIGGIPALDSMKEPVTKVDPQEILGYLSEKNMSPSHAVGVLANIAAESGYNPTAVHDKGTGYGLFGHRLDRRDKLFAHAGTQTPNWRQQIDYAMTEPEMSSYMKQDFGDDVGAAAKAFVAGFERPQDIKGEQERRAKMALNYRHYLQPASAAPTPFPAL